MGKTLKWILYILLGLVGLVLIAGIVYAVFGGYRYTMMGPGVWMWGDHMRFSFSPLRMIFGGLLGLGIFLLVVLGIVALIAALVRGSSTTQTTTTTQVTTPVKPCPNCGKITQEDWKTCPYCGTPLTQE